MYPGEWWTTFPDILGLDDAPPLEQSNSSASPALVELIRQVNALGLSPTERAAALAALEHCFATGNLVLLDLARQHTVPAVTALTATLVGRLGRLRSLGRADSSGRRNTVGPNRLVILTSSSMLASAAVVAQ
ncbi:hypothetical protein D0Z08_06160 [Nocardioides immobilis]|uniref:Uncharacterized protein n=1 Tax=Nocardioides immobilis TaxID=2049295 RepID=A0A417Y5C3_9ACTN|nr:hypothetical protein [Nocardioides immobilis]RHW27873.1 hypothetical protein D0Z08_06160 [Nocardioides immobilis]